MAEPRKVIRVTWKEEDEIAGQPVGPVTLVREGDTRGPRRFDPNRKPPQWMTLREARNIAADHGVELEVF